MARLLAEAGLTVQTDDAGNVIGRRAGRSASDLVMVAAHLDTVFPANTDLRHRREGPRIYAPGISDNGTGLVALLALARAMRDADIKTASTILFVADVGEEGEGNLRGMRKLVETYGRQLRYVIALDGSNTDYVASSALASRRVEVTISGPGGHSWSDFGAPNPIHALSRGIARFVARPVPDSPRTSFNVGSIEGGTSVNSIPARAAIKVDLRSESDTELARLESVLRRDIQAGLDEETAAARKRGFTAAQLLDLQVSVLGIRPGGELPENSPLMAAVLAADRFLGNRSRLERSSTDANIPLSMGIHAIALGAGGHSANAHSLNEWFDPAGRELGLRRALLTLLGVAEVELETPAAR
jgi:acetylornithine deacetylase/succinyl-diaminopimelate desuccinylase-like protein